MRKFFCHDRKSSVGWRKMKLVTFYMSSTHIIGGHWTNVRNAECRNGDFGKIIRSLRFVAQINFIAEMMDVIL
jgi:hypothetical protein